MKHDNAFDALRLFARAGERRRRDLNGQRDRPRHTEQSQPTRYAMRLVSPGLETVCFRVHDTHLLPIADARVRTIAPNSTDLDCL